MTGRWFAAPTTPDRLTAIGPRRTGLLMLLVALAATGCQEVRCSDGREPVTIREEQFCLEVASDSVAIAQGLMHRDHIAEDGGMLFVFPDVSPRTFWMAYCLVDIDIVFLDAQGRITATHRMKAQPPRREDEPLPAYEARMHRQSYPSRLPAQFAIELRAGSLDRLDLHVDDKIELDLPRLKAMVR